MGRNVPNLHQWSWRKPYSGGIRTNFDHVVSNVQPRQGTRALLHWAHIRMWPGIEPATSRLGCSAQCQISTDPPRFPLKKSYGCEHAWLYRDITRAIERSRHSNVITQLDFVNKQVCVSKRLNNERVRCTSSARFIYAWCMIYTPVVYYVFSIPDSKIHHVLVLMSILLFFLFFTRTFRKHIF